MADFVRSDLEFILRQIQIAEANAAGQPLRSLDPNKDSLLPNDEVPWGLRTVDGTVKNLVPLHSGFDAADNTCPRLTAPVFRTVGPGTAYVQTSGATLRASQATSSL